MRLLNYRILARLFILLYGIKFSKKPVISDTSNVILLKSHLNKMTVFF